MGIGGVENEWEYKLSREHLVRWLRTFANLANYLQHSAQELDAFLLKRVLPFEAGRFFPGRNRRLTLNQKTT